MAPTAKFSRLLDLVAVLEFADRPLTRTEIGERLPKHYPPDAAEETVRRKFERDKKDLLDMGVPLVVEEVKGIDPPLEGYIIRYDRTVTTLDDLTDAELAALQSATASLELRHTDAADVLDPTGGLRKLGGIGRGDEEPSRAEVLADANLTTAFGAIVNRRGLAFSYKGEKRSVAPRGIEMANGHWYLSGVDQEKQADRMFRFDRVDGTMLDTDLAEAPDDPDGSDPEGGEAEADGSDGGGAGATENHLPQTPTRFRPWEFGEGESVATRVLLETTVARPALADDEDLRVVARHDDGSIEVELDVRNPTGLWAWLFGFHARAELLGPAELRAAFGDRLRALAGEEG